MQTRPLLASTPLHRPSFSKATKRKHGHQQVHTALTRRLRRAEPKQFYIGFPQLFKREWMWLISGLRGLLSLRVAHIGPRGLLSLSLRPTSGLGNFQHDLPRRYVGPGRWVLPTRKMALSAYCLLFSLSPFNIRNCFPRGVLRVLSSTSVFLPSFPWEVFHQLLH